MGLFNWLWAGRRRGSNPPAPSSKPEPPAGTPSTYLDGVLDPTPLQNQILAACHGMKLRANAEKAAATQLREIAESLVGAISAEQGSIPATTDNGQILVTPPKPQPTGGRLIRGDVDPGPAPVTLLMAIEIAIDNEPFGDEPRAVLLAVARWLRSVGHKFAARDLEREAGK